MKTIISALKKLTTHDITEWAGHAIAGRAKGYIKQVEDLCYSSDGRLVAYVHGSERYLTHVSIDKKGALTSYCSCPYWSTCKHAVALVLAAAEQVKLKQEIPPLTEDDELYDDLFNNEDEFSDEDYAPTPREDGSKRSKREATIETLLSAKTKAELVAFLLDVLPRHPKLIDELKNAEQVKTATPEKLIAKLQRDIKKITAQEAWYDYWNHRGELPDYTPILKQLQALLRAGHADALLALGDELLERGREQIEHSNDEGETSDAIAECMAVVVQALPQSSLTPPEQLFWFITREVADDYQLMPIYEESLSDIKYQPTDWKTLATLIAQKLAASTNTPKGYTRKGWVDWLTTAYECAGMEQEIIPLLEQEAERCNLHTQFIQELLAAGEREKAHKCCIRFYQSTIQELPGIAHDLQKLLRTMAQEDKRHDLVAAYSAQDFFAQTSTEHYQALQKATTKAGSWPAIRLAVLDYLETGKRPDTDAKRKNNSWPLPKPEVEPPENKSPFVQFPDLEKLIRIAILEKRLDDVASLFERFKKTEYYHNDTPERVAEALAASRPQIALDIWQKIAEQHIARAKPAGYVDASHYLRLMHKVYKTTKRLPEWNTLILRLRTTHKAKRRLLEVLDGLENKKLVD